MSYCVPTLRYRVRYTDGEEENLTWMEIVPLLPAYEAQERLVQKKAMTGWLKDDKGKLMSWAKHPSGGYWDKSCCWPQCDGKLEICYVDFIILHSLIVTLQSSIFLLTSKGGDDLGDLLTCYYCSNVQHEECVPLSCPGNHPEIEGEWICCVCWNDYVLYEK